MNRLKKYYRTVGLTLVLLIVFNSDAKSLFLQRTQKPHIVFLISEDPDNYEAHKTIPRFAEDLRREHGFKVSVLLGKGDLNEFKFPNIELLYKADLVVVFFRRIALEENQMHIIKEYLKAGKPLIGIRTANHAFSVRNSVIPEGYEDWWDFVPDILGCKNRGYGSVKLGTDVSVVPDAKDHVILKDFEPARWHSTGNLYHVAPMVDPQANILLTGKVEHKTEPVAWTRRAGKSKIFYTSLGYPDDFKIPQFRNLLINGIKWALTKGNAR